MSLKGRRNGADPSRHVCPWLHWGSRIAITAKVFTAVMCSETRSACIGLRFSLLGHSVWALPIQARGSAMLKVVAQMPSRKACTAYFECSGQTVFEHLPSTNSEPVNPQTSHVCAEASLASPINCRILSEACFR